MLRFAVGAPKGYKCQAGSHQIPIVHEREEDRAYYEGRWFECKAEPLKALLVQSQA